MATTASIDKTARTAREMAQAQRDSFEAIAENFAAAQRRTIGIAEGGLEFMRLQEDNARATQEFFANGVRLLRACANRRATFRTWHLSEGLNSLLTTAWHIRYSPIGAAS